MADDLAMNKWGVFMKQNTPDHLMHVVPVNTDGYLEPPHILSMNCKCCPRLEEDVVVHDWIQ